MKKLSLIPTCILALCLLVGGVVPAYASEENEDSSLIIEDIDSDELEELDKLEMVPVDTDNRKVNITGGFKGDWITDNSLTDERPGKVVGIYGTVYNDDGTGYGFFSGTWQNASGRMTGYLKGKYENGQFRGIWRCLETGMWGPVIGRYSPDPDTTAAEMCCLFIGKWATRDGQLRGSLKGTWSPLVLVRPIGKFAGQWIYTDLVTTANVQPDGKLAGTYGVAVFRDGTRIQYFRGTWDSREGRGGLGGLIVDGRFCGLWNSNGCRPAGYLKGIWRNNRFKGIWKQFGEASEGRLWGVYRPVITATATAVSIEKQPLPVKQITFTSASR